MRYLFLNDSRQRISIHPASDDTGGRTYLEARKWIWVTIPEGTVPWIKIWPTVVLLSSTIDEGEENEDE